MPTSISQIHWKGIIAGLSLPCSLVRRCGCKSIDRRHARTRVREIQTALLSGKSKIVAGTPDPVDPADRFMEGAYGLVYNHAYTVMGIEVPSSNDLSQTYVTVRNPWGHDTGVTFFDADNDDVIDLGEYSDYSYGVDGSNDGLIRLPWNWCLPAASNSSPFLPGRAEHQQSHAGKPADCVRSANDWPFHGFRRRTSRTEYYCNRSGRWVSVLFGTRKRRIHSGPNWEFLLGATGQQRRHSRCQYQSSGQPV